MKRKRKFQSNQPTSIKVFQKFSWEEILKSFFFFHRNFYDWQGMGFLIWPDRLERLALTPNGQGRRAVSPNSVAGQRKEPLGVDSASGGQNWRASHTAPRKPARHRHSKPSTRSLHSPPLRHGSAWQSSTSIWSSRSTPLKKSRRSIYGAHFWIAEAYDHLHSYIYT